MSDPPMNRIESLKISLFLKEAKIGTQNHEKKSTLETKSGLLKGHIGRKVKNSESSENSEKSVQKEVGRGLRTVGDAKRTIEKLQKNIKIVVGEGKKKEISEGAVEARQEKGGWTEKGPKIEEKRKLFLKSQKTPLRK